MSSPQAIGLDPYFLQAYNTPNYYQLAQAQQTQQAQQASQIPAQSASQNVSQSAQASSSPSFQGKSAEKEDSGINWGAIGLTLVTTGIGAAWWFASKGKKAGVEGLWNQIQTGAKSVYDSSKNWIADLFSIVL